MRVGDVIGGRYRVDGLVGEGGMGSVWCATHLVTKKQVALKSLHGRRPDLHARFLREAEAASRVEHPAVVNIQDIFMAEDGEPVMVMELLQGEPLRARLERDGRLELASTLEIMLPVLGAVAAAHAAGIVHRDLKPENVFLSKHGPKVLDFGIAKLLDQADEARLTPGGAVIGTLWYMAPEQALGSAEIDQRVDVWALGAMLYEMLSGRRPVDGDSMARIVQNLMSTPVVPLAERAPDVPPQVCAVIDRMLAKDPDNRWRDLAEVHRALSAHGSEALAQTLLPAAPAPRASSPRASSPRGGATAGTEVGARLSGSGQRSAARPAGAPRSGSDEASSARTNDPLARPGPSEHPARSRLPLALGVAAVGVAAAFALGSPRRGQPPVAGSASQPAARLVSATAAEPATPPAAEPKPSAPPAAPPSASPDRAPTDGSSAPPRVGKSTPSGEATRGGTSAPSSPPAPTAPLRSAEPQPPPSNPPKPQPQGITQDPPF